MKIIIAGIGKLGEYLAKELSLDGNEVTIVDDKVFTNKDIVNNEDVFYINGNALDSNVLIDAGITTTDLLISVMDKDEKNIMCSFLGKKLGVKKTIARITPIKIIPPIIEAIMIFFFLLIEHDLRYTTLLSEMVSLFEILMSSCEGTIELSF